MQLHTREVNTHMCEKLFTQMIKPNPLSGGNLLENLRTQPSKHLFFFKE